MKDIQDLTGDELLDELGVEIADEQTGGYTARQERIIAGFEDILRFFETNRHAPQHSDHGDIFERIYAVRLDQLRKLPAEDLSLLLSMDPHGLLTDAAPAAPLDDDDLLAELGVSTTADISILRHVKPLEDRDDITAAEEIAARVPCKDFDNFKLLFERTQADLSSGARQAKPFEKDTSIEANDFFILDGQLVYVAKVGEPIRTSINDRPDARLRVIYSNGTESNLLRRSLERALYKKERNGRRLTAPDLGPLFAGTMEPDDIPSGTIYVLRSLSPQAEVAAIRDIFHKIGVTGGSVEERIRNAEKDPTYLLAPVEVVATWKLANIRRHRFENTLHRVLASARPKTTLPDRFGNPVQPREWFLVPLPVIDEVMSRFQDESIVDYVYDASLGGLRRV